MVPELRQRHRFIWRMWALLLPIGFVGAIVVLPKKVFQLTLLQTSEAPRTTLEQTQENGWLIANIRTAENGAKQLEIVLKKPLDIPATQLFWQNTFLGSLGAKGVQRFALDSLQVAHPPFTLEIRDPINQTVFQTITFKQ
jgi:hypothetical protein